MNQGDRNHQPQNYGQYACTSMSPQTISWASRRGWTGRGNTTTKNPVNGLSRHKTSVRTEFIPRSHMTGLFFCGMVCTSEGEARPRLRRPLTILGGTRHDALHKTGVEPHRERLLPMRQSRRIQRRPGQLLCAMRGLHMVATRPKEGRDMTNVE